MILIGIAGKKKAGKDTALGLIREICSSDYAVARRAFADALKEEVAIACNVSVSFIDNNKNQFRLLLQGWGTDFRRYFNGEDYWINKLDNNIKDIAYSDPLLNRTTIVVVPDVRFKNEAAYIHKQGGKLIYIWRTIAEKQNDNHPSETSINFRDCDISFQNDHSIQNLHDSIKPWLTEILKNTEHNV